MKREKNLYFDICSMENLRHADVVARKGKKNKYGIRIHDQNRDHNLEQLQLMLINRTYRTSPYTTFKVFEPKEREVFRLPYFPDRIVHHAIMIHMEPLFVSWFTRDTYSCIKTRGIHAAARQLKKALKDRGNTAYCLKMDVKKFYPSVDHEILKELLRRKIKDQDLLWLLDEIIDSAPGLPIGNYLSQYLANYFMCPFDHWIKETKSVKYYFRYADDLVILSDSKEKLHALSSEIIEYLSAKLKLTIKNNYQVFPVAVRGVDFVGYRFFHTHTLLRKSIKKRFARMMFHRPNQASIASYNGWAKHCDAKHLVKKLLA